MNFLLEPEAMGDLLDYITDYKLTYAQILVENLHPDVVLFHDDWGSQDQPLYVSGSVEGDAETPLRENLTAISRARA